MPKLVCKLLNKLDFSNQVQAGTITSYLSDLQIAYGSLLQGRFLGPKIDGSTHYSFKSTGAHKSCTIAELEEMTVDYLKGISGLEPSTRARKVVSLRALFQLLIEENLATRIPHQLRAPKQAQKLPRFISIDEVLSVMALFEEPQKGQISLKHAALFLLLYGCGLRISEACQLKTSDVSLSKRELRVRGKGQKQRAISFPVALKHTLDELIHRNGCGEFIWGDKPLNTRTAYNYIRRCGELAQLSSPLNPHALRHSYATHLLSGGANLRVIQELLGHSNLSATEKYTHVSMDQLSQTLESFHPLAKKSS